MTKEVVINLDGDLFTGTAKELESGKFDPDTFQFDKVTLKKLDCFEPDHYFKVLDLLAIELDRTETFEGCFVEEHNDCLFQL